VKEEGSIYSFSAGFELFLRVHRTYRGHDSVYFCLIVTTMDHIVQGLWDFLSVRLHPLVGKKVCVCGDFNAVKHVDERRSSRDGHRYLDHVPFTRFIEDNTLIDLPLIGRRLCPRPSRMLKYWKDIPSYNLIDGWGGYVLKEKLKMIKEGLKEWHKAHTQNLLGRIETLKGRLSTLDEKGEEDDLSEEELMKLHGVSSDIHSLSRLHASWQQSRSLWLKEGDVNSKYFHSVLAGRCRRNAMSVIQARNVERLRVDDLQFKRLNQVESAGLTKPFTEVEVKSTVWDCDNYKSPGPDGVNFGFIKDLWAELRDDIMRFLSDFHRNGKLTKANRLRIVIDSVISESPTTFVNDRKILDGILIANEVVDEARKSMKDLMLFKVDFEKAYDSMD
ncbi:cysteine-rich receptor-like protein kinase, partial [Trifolium pratense]